MDFERILDEESLRMELDSSREFEEEESDSGDELLYQNKTNQDCTRKKKPIETNDNNFYSYEFTIDKAGEYIKSIYLELDLPRSIEILTLHEKFDILNTQIIFYLDNSVIDKSTVITSLCIENILGNTIKQFENKLQIPITSFFTFKKNNLTKGFPIGNLIFSSLKIILKSKIQLNLQLFTNYLCINNNVKRKKILQTPLECLYLQSKHQEIKSRDKVTSQLIPLYSFLYFIPKFDDIYDLPMINKINIKNKFLHSNTFNDSKLELEYETDQLITLEVLDIQFYIIPYSNMESLNIILKNSNTSKKGYHISHVKIDSLDDLENYSINFVNITKNVLITTNWGIGGMRYSI